RLRAPRRPAHPGRRRRTAAADRRAGRRHRPAQPGGGGAIGRRVRRPWGRGPVPARSRRHRGRLEGLRGRAGPGPGGPRRPPEPPLPDAVKPGIQCVRTHWIRGFMAFKLLRRIRIVMLWCRMWHAWVVSEESELTVAVTGPTGTFGFGLIPLLQAEDRVARIVGIARRPFDPAAHGWTKLEYRSGDVRDQAALLDAFAGADVVVHLAFLVT